MGKLTARKVSTAAPGKHEDGNGLRLVVSATGAKKWVLRVTTQGKRREMGLGAYPVVSLAEARDKAAEARKIAAGGADPIAARNTGKQTVPTFTTCAARYIRAHRRGWANRKHGQQWVRTLKKYARPDIGSKPVNEISTEDVLKILAPIWTTKTETAKRVQGRVENILDYAAALKLRDALNPARWRGHLDKLLPSPRKVARPVHHPAMPYPQVTAFMRELAENDSFRAREKIITSKRS